MAGRNATASIWMRTKPCSARPRAAMARAASSRPTLTAWSWFDHRHRHAQHRGASGPTIGLRDDVRRVPSVRVGVCRRGQRAGYRRAARRGRPGVAGCSSPSRPARSPSGSTATTPRRSSPRPSSATAPRGGGIDEVAMASRDRRCGRKMWPDTLGIMAGRVEDRPRGSVRPRHPAVHRGRVGRCGRWHAGRLGRSRATSIASAATRRGQGDRRDRKRA